MRPPDVATGVTRPHARAVGRLLFSSAIVALAVALGTVDVFVAGWRGGQAWTVARFPAAGTFVLRFALTWASTAAGLWMVSLWLGRRPDLAGVARVGTPLACAGLAALPFVPGVANLLPGLLILSGPMLWVLLGGIALAACWPKVGPRVVERWRGLRFRPVVLVVAAFVVYAALGLTTTRRHGLGGDEPHYLVIVESLIRDGDLRVENNYEARHYSRFVPDGTLPPHAINRGLNGVMYSVHAPGLPLLLAPAYAVAGRPGANVLMALLGAAGSLAVFLLARSFAGVGPGITTWAAVAFGIPWLVHGWLIFPEMAAACIASWTMWWVWQERTSDPSDARAPAGSHAWFWRGFVLGTLPWFHAKFAALLTGLAIAVCASLWRRPRVLAACGAPIAALAGLWFFAFFVMYGVADPTMPYGGLSAMSDLAWGNVPRGILGLLFDQEFGLLPYSPVFALLPFGLAGLVRDRSRRHLVGCAFLAGGLFVASTTRYYMWWGGSSAPARFLVPVLPLMAPVLAAALARLSATVWGRAVIAVMLTFTLAISIVLVFDPSRAFLVNDRDGTGNLLAVMEGAGSWTRLLPSLWRLDWLAELPRVAVFAGGLAAGMLASWWIGQRVAGYDARAIGGEGCLALAFVFGAVLGVSVLGRLTLTLDARDATIRDGQLRLLNAWAPGGWVEMSRARPLSGRALLQRLEMPLVSRGAAASHVLPEEPASWLGPFSLPAGVYDLRVWPREESQLGPASGEFLVRLAESATVVAAVPTSDDRPQVIRFEVPHSAVPARISIGVSTPDLIERIARVGLYPIEIAPRDRP